MTDRPEEQHTKAPVSGMTDVHHCLECSEVANEWVQWPCSRERLVEAAVSSALYLRSMDEVEDLERSYHRGFIDGQKKKKKVKRDGSSATTKISSHRSNG